MVEILFWVCMAVLFVVLVGMAIICVTAITTR